MPTIETGFFLLLLALSVTFTFGAFKTVGNVKGILHIIAVALFAILGAYTAAGYEVSNSHSTTYDDGLTQWNETGTDVFISGGTDTYWISYVFMGLAMLNLILFVKDVWTGT